jgi:NCS1 family nucleobase:cation symporter-1
LAGIRLPRNVSAALTATLAFFFALVGVGRFSSLYENYLFLFGYWVAPWVAIVLADWYLRRGVEPLERRGWLRGATIFVVVATATILLFSSTDLYTGPVTRWLGGADIGYFVGFIAAALLYVVTAPAGEKAADYKRIGAVS